MPTNWLEEIRGLSAADLTVQAQAISVDDVDQVYHQAFFPERDVDSTELDVITTLDNRYAASYREWNARGRYIPQATPKIDRLTMIPIEGYDKIGEEEQQRIDERVAGNDAVFRQIIGASVPARVDKLVRANFRRREAAAMEAWAKGTITYENPSSGATQVLTFGFDAGRLQTAATAWNDAGTNAYSDLIAWLEDAQTTVGPIEGVVMRRATYNAIVADAPNPMPGAQSGLAPTRVQLAQRVSDEISSPFRFVILEHTFDKFTDGGTATTSTNYWPAQYVAAIPAGRQVGSVMRAPVRRARQLANQIPLAGIDIRGMTVFYDEENTGRTIVIECQANHLPVPNEQKVFTINAGV